MVLAFLYSQDKIQKITVAEERNGGGIIRLSSGRGDFNHFTDLKKFWWQGVLRRP